MLALWEEVLANGMVEWHLCAKGGSSPAIAWGTHPKPETDHFLSCIQDSERMEWSSGTSARGGAALPRSHGVRTRNPENETHHFAPLYLKFEILNDKSLSDRKS